MIPTKTNKTMRFARGRWGGCYSNVDEIYNSIHTFTYMSEWCINLHQHRQREELAI
jgi:hypothetical protein